MGEFADYGGDRVKIGTCEEMYYLRADQRHQVQAVPGSVNPNSDRDILALRFRFPWPDEDATARPGHDDDAHDFDRGLPVRVEDWTADQAEHYSIQFQAKCSSGTLLASLPCPYGEQPEGGPPARIARNGWCGDVVVCQQGFRDHGAGVRLVTIARCPACGSKYQLTQEEAERVAVAIRSEADRTHYDYRANDGQGAHVPYHGEERVAFLHGVADRMLAGYHERKCSHIRPWEAELVPAEGGAA